MRRVYDGITYDNNQATYLAQWDNYDTMGRGSFQSCHEELYITKCGRFFLWGNGGAMTRWNAPVSLGGIGTGIDLLPLSDDDAKEWVLMHAADSYDAVNNILHYPSQDDSKGQLIFNC